MDITGLIVNLVSGVAGGNIVGAAWKEKTLGAVGNSIAGLIGGAAGGYILQGVGVLNSLGMSNMTVGSVLGHVGASAAGGAILTAIAGFIKSSMDKSKKV